MDSFLLNTVLSQLEFCDIWRWRGVSKWCKREIEESVLYHVNKITLEVCAEEDEFVLFPRAALIFRCAWYDADKNIFRFELDKGIKSATNANESSKGDNSAHNTICNHLDAHGNFVPPSFLKFWEKYCRCTISFNVNNKHIRSYYTQATTTPTKKSYNTWYKTDTVYYGLRTRLADYDFFLDFHRPMSVFKELIARGFVRTKSTQAKLALMQEDVQRIIKDLNLNDDEEDECPIYIHASPSFLFPQLRDKVCVFPDRLQVLEDNDDKYDITSMAVVKWLASRTPQIPKVFNTQNYTAASFVR
jgi:hypothetical protein